MYSGHAIEPGKNPGNRPDARRFEWELAHATLSTYRPDVHASRETWQQQLAATSVCVQWDPERDWQLGRVEGVRAIQIGLSGDAVQRYVDEWIVRIEKPGHNLLSFVEVVLVDFEELEFMSDAGPPATIRHAGEK